MESHAKRCLQHHVWHGIPSQSDPKLGLTWSYMSIPWWHVPCQMQHFRRVLGYINLTWDSMANWCHRAHTILSWSSMSNLTWVPCQKRLDTEFHVKGSLGAYRNDFASISHGIPVQRVLSKVWDGGTSVYIPMCFTDFRAKRPEKRKWKPNPQQRQRKTKATHGNRKTDNQHK